MKNSNEKLYLQLFASDSDTGEVSVVSGPSDVDDSVASDSDNNATAEPADSIVNDESSLELEFEKLIKGGKFESAFQKRTQSIIDKRFKTLKTLEEQQENFSPVLDLLSKRYGTSDSSALLDLLQKESTEKADAPLGDNTSEKNAESVSNESKSKLISAKADLTYNRWIAEGKSLKNIFPDFDFKTELKNPAFASLLKSGVSVRQAYTAVHSDAIIKNAVSGTAKRVREQTMKNILANGNRVSENGVRSPIGVIRKTDVNSLTGKDIRSILKQVEDGTKIRF